MGCAISKKEETAIRPVMPDRIRQTVQYNQLLQTKSETSFTHAMLSENQPNLGILKKPTKSRREEETLEKFDDFEYAVKSHQSV